MALTKIQALEKFCTFMKYEQTKLPNETKADFFTRKKKALVDGWFKSIVKDQLSIEAKQAADIESQVNGLEA